MKILVSSKNLYKILSKVLQEGLVDAEYGNATLRFYATFEAYFVRGEAKDKAELRFSNKIRWDYICEVLSLIPEQPITLNFDKNNVKMILEVDANLVTKDGETEIQNLKDI